MLMREKQMKKLIVLAFTVFTLNANVAFAEELEPELTEASQAHVISLVKLCNDYAKEDEVAASHLDKYLLTCINDELDSGFFKPVSELPEIKTAK